MKELYEIFPVTHYTFPTFFFQLLGLLQHLKLVFIAIRKLIYTNRYPIKQHDANSTKQKQKKKKKTETRATTPVTIVTGETGTLVSMTIPMTYTPNKEYKEYSCQWQQHQTQIILQNCKSSKEKKRSQFSCKDEINSNNKERK